MVEYLGMELFPAPHTERTGDFIQRPGHEFVKRPHSHSRGERDAATDKHQSHIPREKPIEKFPWSASTYGLDDHTEIPAPQPADEQPRSLEYPALPTTVAAQLSFMDDCLSLLRIPSQTVKTRDFLDALNGDYHVLVTRKAREMDAAIKASGKTNDDLEPGDSLLRSGFFSDDPIEQRDAVVPAFYTYLALFRTANPPSSREKDFSAEMYDESLLTFPYYDDLMAEYRRYADGRFGGDLLGACMRHDWRLHGDNNAAQGEQPPLSWLYSDDPRITACREELRSLA